MQSTTTSPRLATLSAAATPVLDDILREGARRMLQQAIEREVADYVAAHAGERDAGGRRLVVRNGRHPARRIQTSLGPI